MAKRCNTCGEEGHTTRTCPEKEAERLEKQRQRALKNPTVVHMASRGFGKTYKCGAERVEWPERCMTDSFARTLPACESCLSIWKEENPDKTIEIN